MAEQRQVWMKTGAMTRWLVAVLVLAAVAVAPAGGAPGQTPKRGGTVFTVHGRKSACLNPFAACNFGRDYRSTIRNITPNPLEVLWRTENWWLER